MLPALLPRSSGSKSMQEYLLVGYQLVRRSAKMEEKIDCTFFWVGGGGGWVLSGEWKQIWKVLFLGLRFRLQGSGNGNKTEFTKVVVIL